MTPETLATMTALITLLKSIGVLPLSMIIVLIVLSPWVLMAIALQAMRKDQEKRNAETRERFEAVVQMYKDNVELVKNYERVAEGLQDILILSTQTMTQVLSSVSNNLFCPLMRKDQKTERHT